jgi:hypothetical protein
VCRERSVVKLDDFESRITVIPGATNDRHATEKAIAGCDGVLIVGCRTPSALAHHPELNMTIRHGPSPALPGRC